MSESESVRSMYFRVKLEGDEDVGETQEAINVGHDLLGPISHPEIEERVAKRVLLEKEYQCSLSPYEKVRTNKEDDVSSFEYAHILGWVCISSMKILSNVPMVSTEIVRAHIPVSGMVITPLSGLYICSLLVNTLWNLYPLPREAGAVK